MSPRKPFRLRQVLERERQREELKQRELSTLAQQQRVAEGELQTLVTHADGVRADHARRRGERIDPHALELARGYLDAVTEAIREHEDRMRELERQVLSSREELIEILRRKRMLEHLQHRHEADLAAAEDRREQAEADDRSATRFARQGGEWP